MRWSVVAGYNVSNTLENKNLSRGFIFFCEKCGDVITLVYP